MLLDWLIDALRRVAIPKTVLAVAAASVVLYQGVGVSSTFTWDYTSAESSEIRGPVFDSLLTDGMMSWNCCADCYVDMLCITYVQDGAIAVGRDMDLKCGISALSAKVGNNNGATISIHMDSPDSAAVCTLSVPSASAEDYIVYTNELPERVGGGVHDMYVKFSGSGFLGSFIWLQFDFGCERTASTETNWTPNGVPASGDTIDFSGAPTSCVDTILWDLDIEPSYINFDSYRSVGMRFDALQNLGVDTLRIANLNILQGHLIAPAGFVIDADAVDTNGAVLPEGEYTEFSSRYGLAFKLSFGGGGKLLVGPASAATWEFRPEIGSVMGIVRVFDNAIVVGSNAQVSRIDLYDSRGVLVRHRNGGNSISTVDLPRGSYLLRARVGEHTMSRSVIAGK